MNFFVILGDCKYPLARSQLFHLLKKLLLTATIGVFSAHIGIGLASSNLVPETGVVDAVLQSPITPDHLKPPECSGITPTTLILGSGSFTGTPDNDLILGSSANDRVDGLDGDDCILGGDQGDQLFGGASGGGSETVRDEFNAVSYSNNDGTQNWASDWLEFNEADGPASGDVMVDIPTVSSTYTLYASQDAAINQAAPNNNYGTNIFLALRSTLGQLRYSLLSYDLSSLPAGATVISAIANFYVTTADTHPVNVYRVTSAWGEFTVTWNSFANAYNSTIRGTFTPTPVSQYVSADVTSLVQAWHSGTNRNYGLVLIATATAGDSLYNSRDQPGTINDPYLEVTVSVPAGDNSLRIQNASKAITRSVDLCNATSATLDTNFFRQGLDDANDYVDSYISDDGGGSWTLIGRIDGPADDTELQFGSVDISAFISCDTVIAFLSSPSLGVDDRVFFDNIQISYQTLLSTGGNDVLIGGAGDDYLNGGGGEDICYGGGGVNTFDNCEVIFDP